MQIKYAQIPKFKNEKEERKFWAVHDASDYFNFNKKVNLDLSELKLSAEKSEERTRNRND